LVRDQHSKIQHACVTQGPVKITKSISLDISQNDSIGIIDLQPSLFVDRNIREHLFDDVNVAPTLQGIVVRILRTVSGMQFCVNLVPIFSDAATEKNIKGLEFRKTGASVKLRRKCTHLRGSSDASLSVALKRKINSMHDHAIFETQDRLVALKHEKRLMRTYLSQFGASEAGFDNAWRPCTWTEFGWLVVSLLSKSYVFTNKSFSFLG